MFLFQFKQDPLLRPSVGDVLSNPITREEFKILRDEVPVSEATIFRITDDSVVRMTDDGRNRIIQFEEPDPSKTTHSYFVTPANNPNRIVSWSTNTFDDDQTLQQLFR